MLIELQLFYFVLNMKRVDDPVINPSQCFFLISQQPRQILMWCNMPIGGDLHNKNEVRQKSNLIILRIFYVVQPMLYRLYNRQVTSISNLQTFYSLHHNNEKEIKPS